MDEENPELAMENRVIVRDENRSIEDTFALVERELGL